MKAADLTSRVRGVRMDSAINHAKNAVSQTDLEQQLQEERLRAKQLQAECDRLRGLLREVTEERDAYLRSLYAWARSQATVPPDEHLVAEEDGIPLQQVIEELLEGE
jgi:hypothetical protein